MGGQTRNIYPGGNTPFGFYSYYNHILPQMEAKKIFCIKGGPGTGKSTMMKNIADYFLNKEEAVDFMWCSSDPSSVDGILLKKRAVAIVDGTAPHITDPKNPGAVDEIVNMGECWNEKEIAAGKIEIIKCNRKIGTAFENAYGYLKCAWQQYEFMNMVLERLIPERYILEAQRQLDTGFNRVTALKRTESKIKKERALGKELYPGKRKKFFAGAITPRGVKSEVGSLIKGMTKIIVLDAPIGFKTQKILKSAADRLSFAGFDIEEYYCPMDPAVKLEHVICPDAAVAVVSSNKYHPVDIEEGKNKLINIKAYTEDIINGEDLKLLKELQSRSKENIADALKFLEIAKEHHDILEGYYIPNMNFDKVEEIKDEIIGKIEGMVL